MVVKREAHRVIVPPEYEQRIAAGQCAVCGIPKSDWPQGRPRSAKTCSKDHGEEYQKNRIWGWGQLKDRVHQRDNFTCVRCGLRPTKMVRYSSLPGAREHEEIDHAKLVADHIIPIAIGGPQWDINNIQTLCEDCNKAKTRGDQGEIAVERKKDKAIGVGGCTLDGFTEE